MDKTVPERQLQEIKPFKGSANKIFCLVKKQMNTYNLFLHSFQIKVYTTWSPSTYLSSQGSKFTSASPTPVHNPQHYHSHPFIPKVIEVAAFSCLMGRQEFLSFVLNFCLSQTSSLRALVHVTFRAYLTLWSHMGSQVLAQLLDSAASFIGILLINTPVLEHNHTKFLRLY